MIDSGAAHELAWNWTIVAYFFLGGVGAGLYLLSVAANYWLPEFKPAAKAAAVAAPVALAVGTFFVWLDLGMKSRVFLLFTSFNRTAPASWGSWFLALSLAISAIYALACLTGKEAKVKAPAIAGVPLALLVASYTGVLLNRAAGRPLWHSAMLPALFLNGGLLSGFAMALLLCLRKLESAARVTLGWLIACLIAVELVMVFAEVAILAAGSTADAAAAQALLTGQFSVSFWAVQIAGGSLIPFLILVFDGKGRVALQAIASLLVLIGIYAMRHIIVIGGQVVG